MTKQQKSDNGRKLVSSWKALMVSFTPPRPSVRMMSRILFGADLVFILAALIFSVAYWIGWASGVPRYVSLEYDHSIANIYNYSKWALIAVVFVALWSRSRQPLHATLSLIFAAVFLDDAFSLHEAVNVSVSEITEAPAHYAGIVTLIFLAISAGLLASIAWKKSDSRSRSDAKYIIIATLLLIVFGGGLDTMQSVVGDSRHFIGIGIGLLEDGIELLAASIILSYAITFLIARGSVVTVGKAHLRHRQNPVRG